jgi:Domain of unknown function (DUF1996)
MALRSGRLVPCAAAALALAATSNSATPRASDFPGGSYFAVICSFSHRNNDDPIVFPGQPGRSHNHTYIGNRSVNALSTAASLRGGDTTCELAADASAYWAPTLYVRTDPIVPLAGIVYYVKRTTAPVVPFPVGLKMVAGNANATKAQGKGIVAWSCGGIGGKPRFTALPACREDQGLELRVHFPDCWNGKALDSPDHKRHMAYSSAGVCPDSHPVPVPMLAVVLLYPTVPARAQLASGRFGGHADFMNGWEPDAFARLVTGLNYG